MFIDPTGKSSFGIGLCARCSRKFSLEELHSDPNSPGLMVCLDDLDEYDPYRLPARQTEEINLDFVRPDELIIMPDDTNAGNIAGVWLDGVWLGWADDSWFGMDVS